MSKKRLSLILMFVAALALAAGDSSRAQTQTGAELTERFSQTWPLTAGGRVSLSNINGNVRVSSWERNEVRVDAVKRAYRAERLSEAEIRVEARADSIRIETKYPNYHWEGRRPERHENPASVEYTLTVPRSAMIEGLNLINGDLSIENISGSVKANSINGRVSAKGLTGPVNLSVINGRLEAVLDRLGEGQSVSLSSVNGELSVTLPSDASAHLRASTVHGQIVNDFGLPVRVGEYVGRDLEGRLGAGAARVRLSNVNGTIRLRRAADNRSQSPVTNLLSETRASSNDGDTDEAGEIARGVREAQREAQREAREARREAAELARETTRATREAMRELERTTQSRGGSARQTANESSSFAVSGSPRVRLETFDGSISVRAWDKSEVAYTAIKRASDERELQGIRVSAQGDGSGGVTIRTEFDRSHATQRVERGGRTVVFSSGASVELEVYVPRNSVLSISSGDGRVRVEGVTGEIDLRTGDGPVEVTDSRGRLRAETGDGPVRVINFDGDAEARTGDGRITLDGRFKSLTAHTGDGSITLTVPSDFNFNIETDARSVTGDDVVAEGGAGDGRVRRWRVGAGGNTLRLHTGEGQIIVRRR